MKLHYPIISILISLSILSLSAQKQDNSDKSTYNSLSQKYDSVFRDYLSKRTKVKEEQLYQHFNRLKLKVNDVCLTEPNACDSVNYKFSKEALNLIMLVFHRNQAQDSILHYHNYILKNSKSNYLIGRSYQYKGFVQHLQKDFGSHVDSKLKSIEYLKKADKKTEREFSLFVYMDLIDFYLRYTGGSNYAKQMLSLLEVELSNYKDSPKYNSNLATFNLINSIYYDKKGDYKKSLEALESIDPTILSINILYYYYFDSIKVLLKNNNVEKAALLYDKATKNESIKNENFPDYLMVKSFVGARLYLLTGNNIYKKDMDYIVKQSEPIENEDFEPEHLELVSNYYQKTGNYKKAYAYNVKKQELEKNIKETSDKILNDLSLYNLRKEQEIGQLKLAQEKQKNNLIKTRRNYIIIFILLFSILVIVFIILFQKRKRANLKVLLELEKSKEVNAAKTTFLENISHEIRTPITIVNGYNSLIQESVLKPKKILSYTKLISQTSDNLIYSLNNFLTIFRSEEKDNRLELESKDLNQFCRNSSLNFKSLCEIKKIKLYYKTNIKDTFVIDFEYNNLQKIIYNLISNALKYSNSNTNIFISLHLENDRFKLSIKDEGMGIAKEEQHQIFERFYQSKKHNITGGFGIGLSLVHSLVQKLNGTLELKSEVDKGSIFTIYLPVLNENNSLYINSLHTDFELLTDSLTGITHHKNLPKALIVDDNINLIKFYEDVFESFLAITFAFNGKEALDLLKNESFDIIISDLRMPTVDGITFKEQINKDETLKDIPFMIVTAITLDLVDDLKMNLGVNDYIVKPFEKNEIITRVKALLKNKIYLKKLAAKDNLNTIEFKDQYSELLEKVNAVIRKNLNNTEFGVAAIASECGYEVRNLNAILQEKTGLTLVYVVLEVRLQKAYELIINNSFSTLGEIMFEVGFNSRPHFYKKFEERFGIKPGELKKKYANSF